MADEEGSEEMKGRHGKLLQGIRRYLQGLGLRPFVTSARCKRMLTEKLCLRMQDALVSSR